jgi:hypothetical protein
VSNVILAGTLFYRPSLYEGMARAAAGKGASEGPISEEQVRQIERGEHRHLILQALCRGAVRRSQGSTCGSCDAYVIAATATGIPMDIAEVFPGCRVVLWAPIKRKLTGKVKMAAELIVDFFQSNEANARLPFTAVRKHLGGMSAGNFKRSIRDHGAFRDFCDEHGIYDVGSGRYPRWFSKSPFPPLTKEEWAELEPDTDLMPHAIGMDGDL